MTVNLATSSSGGKFSGTSGGTDPTSVHHRQRAARSATVFYGDTKYRDPDPHAVGRPS